MLAGFWEVVDLCGFTDLGYSGLPYTWDNRQERGRNIKARLDRALGDENFLQVMGETAMQHVQLASSDHYALLNCVRETLEIHFESQLRTGNNNCVPCRYENMWQLHGEYE